MRTKVLIILLVFISNYIGKLVGSGAIDSDVNNIAMFLFGICISLFFNSKEV